MCLSAIFLSVLRCMCTYIIVTVAHAGLFSISLCTGSKSRGAVRVEQLVRPQTWRFPIACSRNFTDFNVQPLPHTTLEVRNQNLETQVRSRQTP